jgi:putative transposase
MARLPRLCVPGVLHLVTQSGHDDKPIVVDDTDRSKLLALLAQAASAEGMAIHAYALTDCELRLLATPQDDDSLARVMQALGRRYVVGFNRRHGRRGTLWAGRYRAGLVDPALAIDATVFVEALPVHEGLAAQAADWPWSSAQHHAGIRRNSFVTEHNGYWSLGNTPFERESAHANHLACGVPVELGQRLDRAVRRGLAVGSPEFLRQIGGLVRRPVEARPRGRPPRAAAPI